MVDFIGVGAQKAGTSWVYACLYEHPEVCAPVKEIHFFSRPRFSKGKDWYESHFDRCDEGTKKGEFSTSYLYSEVAAERIAHMYSDAKLIAIVRNPIDRAYSHYCNSLKAGLIPKDMQFDAFAAQDVSVLEQGKYVEQLKRYMQYFSRKQLLVLVYEDIQKDPAAFMKQVYQHLEINPEFEPTMLHDRVNIARIPRFIFIERLMHRVAEYLRKIHLDKLVWLIRKTNIPNHVRVINTERMSYSSENHGEVYDRKALQKYYAADVAELGVILGRNLTEEWSFQEHEKKDQG